MKGVVFNIFEDFICEGWGDEAYEALLKACPVHQDGYVGPESYPDADMIALVTKACERFGVDGPDALRAFGKFMLPKLVEKFPKFVDGHTHPKSFLMSVEDVIHVEVRKLFKDAVTPSFGYENTAPDRLVIKYTSDRQMCHLMEGLLDGVAAHYKTTIEHSQTQCMHDGAGSCDFDLKFAA